MSDPGPVLSPQARAMWPLTMEGAFYENYQCQIAPDKLNRQGGHFQDHCKKREIERNSIKTKV